MRCESDGRCLTIVLELIWGMQLTGQSIQSGKLTSTSCWSMFCEFMVASDRTRFGGRECVLAVIDEVVLRERVENVYETETVR
jgi:hypothetical protein